MTPRESWERVEQGLKMASSCARQLALAQKDTSWTKVAFGLETLSSRAQTIYSRRALSRQEALTMVDARAKALGVETEH